jgi:hypothetical protein
MDLQYSIINQCLQLLKQSDLPTIKKLRVEIQLIQMKRLLLNDAIPTEIQSGSCSMEACEQLLRQMRAICVGSCDQSALSELMDQIGGLLIVLGGDQAAR